jgi:hypothetical protein
MGHYCGNAAVLEIKFRYGGSFLHATALPVESVRLIVLPSENMCVSETLKGGI